MTLDQAEVGAREEIRGVLARYCTAADAGRLDEVVGLFAADGRIEFRGEMFAGPDGIKGMFVDSGRRVVASGLRGRLMHTVTTIDLIVGGDSGTGNSCFQVLSRAGLDHWGRYADQYVVEDGSWRIARRVISVEGRVPGGFGEVLS